MPTPTLNPDYQLIYRKAETGQLYFKNSFFGNLLQLSEAEYDIIRAYVQHADYAATAAQFADEFDFGPDLVPQLVSRAEDLDLLLTPRYVEKRSQASRQRHGRLLESLRYFTYWLSQHSNRVGMRIRAEFRGNFRFYRLFSVEFQHSWFDRFCGSAPGQLFFLLLALLTLGAAGTSLAHTGLGGLSVARLLNTAPVGSPAGLLLTITGGLLLSTLLHELGHFVVYRRYGGQTSEMGAALTLGLFPVLYVTTNSLYLWDSQRRRLLVTAAGILVDGLQVLGLLAVLLRAPTPALTFYSLIFLYLVGVRILANLNPFIPGTDGYFLATDVLGLPSLYQAATFAGAEAAGLLRGFAFGLLTRRHWGFLLYLTLSVASITLYYTLLGGVLVLPLLGQLR